MKKIVLLSSIFLMIIQSNAQILNADFESLKPNFLPNNWGMNFIIPVSIDVTTGENTADALQYSNCLGAMCGASWNPHTGTFALEISNVFNQTQNKTIAGQAILFADSTQDSPGYNPGMPINIGPITTQIGLGFFYQFATTTNDIAQANLELIDQDGNVVGRVSQDILPTDATYHYAFFPLENPVLGAIPVFANINFTTAKPGTNPNFGSILTIDDISLTNSLLQTNQQEKNAPKVYPTIAKNELYISYNFTNNNPDMRFEIFDLQGKLISNTTTKLSDNTIQIDISKLAAQMYVLKISDHTTSFVSKFIKK